MPVRDVSLELSPMQILPEAKRSPAELSRTDRGLSIIFFAIALPAIISLLVLVVGGAFLMINKSRLNDIAEMAAFSALKAYHVSPWPAFPQRANEGLTAANDILALNSLNNQNGPLDPIGLTLPTETGQLTLGHLYRKAPPSGPVPAGCNGGYPCFTPYDPANPMPVNASKVELNAAGVSAIKVPFLERALAVRAMVVATTSGSATVVVLDTSLSMTGDTHLEASTSVPPARGAYPSGVTTRCGAPTTVLEQSFCAQPADRTVSSPFDPRTHYRDDYKVTGNLAVDSFGSFASNTRYTGPEPLSTAFMLANIAFRKTAAASFPGDSWRLIAARGQAPLLIPGAGQEGLGLPDYLIQLTNFDNRGLYDANGTLLRPYPHSVHPNPLDTDLLPDPNVLGDETPLSAAVSAAITELNGIQWAPKRNLVIISDGVGNCSSSLGCIDSLQGYQAAESELLGLVPNLVSSGIDVTVVPVGGNIEPHLLNIIDPLNSTTSTGGVNYLTPEVAADLDYNGLGSGNLLFDSVSATDPQYLSWCTANCPTGCDPSCADRYAYQYRGRPGVVFRRSMAALGDLGLKMSRAELGRLCLIQPSDPVTTHYIDHDDDPLTPSVLDSSYRVEGKRQVQSIIAGEAGEQLAGCLDKAPRSFGMEIVIRD